MTIILYLWMACSTALAALPMELGEKLEKALAITKGARVPLMLDDAAGIPPIENLRKYAKLNIDLYCFSGGKGLGGPQCSGILLGRKDLIEAALANTSPWEGAICRYLLFDQRNIVIGFISADFPDIAFGVDWY